MKFFHHSQNMKETVKMGVDNADFSGWATKANLKCADGRTIMPDAFAHMDGKQIPLVWHHGHDNPDNVLGHAILEARPEGMYAYGFFNNTAPGQQAKAEEPRRPSLGVQDWYVGPAQVFVLPGTSGANQRRDYDGRPNRLSWWRDLALICGRDTPD